MVHAECTSCFSRMSSQCNIMWYHSDAGTDRIFKRSLINYICCFAFTQQIRKPNPYIYLFKFSLRLFFHRSRFWFGPQQYFEAYIQSINLCWFLFLLGLFAERAFLSTATFFSNNSFDACQKLSQVQMNIYGQVAVIRLKYHLMRSFCTNDWMVSLQPISTFVFRFICSLPFAVEIYA